MTDVITSVCALQYETLLELEIKLQKANEGTTPDAVKDAILDALKLIKDTKNKIDIVFPG